MQVSSAYNFFLHIYMILRSIHVAICMYLQQLLACWPNSLMCVLHVLLYAFFLGGHQDQSINTKSIIMVILAHVLLRNCKNLFGICTYQWDCQLWGLQALSTSSLLSRMTVSSTWRCFIHVSFPIIGIIQLYSFLFFCFFTRCRLIVFVFSDV